MQDWGQGERALSRGWEGEKKDSNVKREKHMETETQRERDTRVKKSEK